MSPSRAPLGSYAAWQDSRPSTPRPVLIDLVRRVTGAEIVRIDRIMEGYSNEVHRVRCVDGPDLVLRILRYDDVITEAVSAGEAWAINRARAAGVPAPEILLHDQLRMDGAEFPIMIQRAAPGRSLAVALPRLSEAQRNDVLVEFGGLIARLGTVRIEDASVGRPPTPAATWREARDLILAGGLSDRQFVQVIDLVADHAGTTPGLPLVLCHGDLSLKHVFVTGAGTAGDPVRVSGIIDFGDWTAGVPVHDLAVLRAREPGLELTPVITGYGAADDAAFIRQWHRHSLDQALASLIHHVREGDRAAVARTVSLITDLLGEFDRDPDGPAQRRLR